MNFTEEILQAFAVLGMLPTEDKNKILKRKKVMLIIYDPDKSTALDAKEKLEKINDAFNKIMGFLHQLEEKTLSSAAESSTSHESTGNNSELITLYERKIKFYDELLMSGSSISGFITSDNETYLYEQMTAYCYLAEIYLDSESWVLAEKNYSLANSVYLRISSPYTLSDEEIVRFYFGWVYAAVANMDLEMASHILRNATTRWSDMFSHKLDQLVSYFKNNKEKTNTDPDNIKENERSLRFAISLAKTYVHLHQLSHAQYFYEKITDCAPILIHLCNSHKDLHSLGEKWCGYYSNVLAELGDVKYSLEVTKDRCNRLHSSTDWREQVKSLFASAILAYQENKIEEALSLLQTAKDFYTYLYQYLMPEQDNSTLGDLHETTGEILFSQQKLKLAKEEYRYGLHYQKRGTKRDSYPAANKIKAIERYEENPDKASLDTILRGRNYAFIPPFYAYSHDILKDYISRFKREGFFTSPVKPEASEKNKPQASTPVYHH